MSHEDPAVDFDRRGPHPDRAEVVSTLRPSSIGWAGNAAIAAAVRAVSDPLLGLYGLRAGERQGEQRGKRNRPDHGLLLWLIYFRNAAALSEVAFVGAA
jgi:hypothetical protein